MIETMLSYSAYNLLNPRGDWQWYSSTTHGLHQA